MNITKRNTVAVIAFVMLCVNTGPISGQELKIEKISISSRNYDEISPVFYGDGIVFCTNRRTNSLMGYANDDSRLYKLFYSTGNSVSRWSTPKLFSTEITTTFNEGPATFNREGTLIYFTKNHFTSGRFSNVNDSSNRLGIFSAELINGIWQNIRPFVYSDPLYTFATPSLAHDGQRIYFSSDMPGGHGGMDIYYCNKCGSEWCDPVNVGPEINTAGNETYPYIDSGGKLYFSSDGHPGSGGKDIYYTFEENGIWISPVSMDSLINSSANDYGIIVDSTGINGFFTSDRQLSADIYRFSTILPEFDKCDTFREPSYCFTIYDERYIPNDTLILHYKWDFGNGIIKSGPQVGHCFPGPGEYKIMLDITDELTGDTVAWQVQYDVVLDPPSQLFITAPNVSITKRLVEFTTDGSLINGEAIRDFAWDFGDGYLSGISKIEHRFNGPGEYSVTAGMSNHTGNECVTKRITVIESIKEIMRTVSANGNLVSILADPHVSDEWISELGKIGERLQVIIDQNGIQPKTLEFLEKLVSLCNESGLHMELQVYNKDNPDKSVTDSRELSFYLKNHLPEQHYGVHISDHKEVLTDNIGSASVIYEFIVMKK